MKQDAPAGIIQAEKEKDPLRGGARVASRGDDGWVHAVGTVPVAPGAGASIELQVGKVHEDKGALQLGFATGRWVTPRMLRKDGDCVSWGSSGEVFDGKSCNMHAAMAVVEGDVVSAVVTETSIKFSLSRQGANETVQIPIPLGLFSPIHVVVSVLDAKVKVLPSSGYAAWSESRFAEFSAAQKSRAEQNRAPQHSVAAHKLAHFERLLAAGAGMEVQEESTWSTVDHVVAGTGAYNSGGFGGLPGRLLKEILTLLPSGADSARAQNVCQLWRQVGLAAGLREKFEPVCFFTKFSTREAVLGLGLNVLYRADGSISQVDCALDPVSHHAFSLEKVREGLWREEFNHFLPLVLDGDHASRAKPLLERCIARIVVGPGATFEPWMILILYPAVMNSFVVSLVTTSTESGPARHASEKALEGYCSFHHAFLYLSQQYPEVVQIATRRLQNFLSNETYRTKAETPDVGQLLVYLAITPAKSGGWEALAPKLLEECFDRNVRWMLKGTPSLGHRGVAQHHRLRETFDATLTSYRLLMFQALFLHEVGRPSGISRDKVLHRYNQQFGLPTSQQRDALFDGCRRIFAVSEWVDFFAALGLTMPTEAALCARLEEAIDRSWSKGYHGPVKGPKAFGTTKILQREFASICQTKKDEDEKRQGREKEKKEGKEKKEKKEGKEKEKEGKEKKEKKEKKDKFVPGSRFSALA